MQKCDGVGGWVKLNTDAAGAGVGAKCAGVKSMQILAPGQTQRIIGVLR